MEWSALEEVAYVTYGPPYKKHLLRLNSTKVKANSYVIPYGNESPTRIPSRCSDSIAAAATTHQTNHVTQHVT